MPEHEQRMLRLASGKRMPIRLDEATWRAVDWLAAQSHQSWSDWCARIVESTPEGENITATVRSAAMQGLLSATIFNERAEMYASAGPIWQSLGMCGDPIFHEVLEEARKEDRIEGEEDFVGFKLAAGVSEFGRVAFYIENGIKEGCNLFISTPFTLEEWAAKMESES